MTFERDDLKEQLQNADIPDEVRKEMTERLKEVEAELKDY
jgi:hypothetical protein